MLSWDRFKADVTRRGAQAGGGGAAVLEFEGRGSGGAREREEENGGGGWGPDGAPREHISLVRRGTGAHPLVNLPARRLLLLFARRLRRAPWQKVSSRAAPRQRAEHPGMER